jgi:hypothetical protein
VVEAVLEGDLAVPSEARVWSPRVVSSSPAADPWVYTPGYFEAQGITSVLRVLPPEDADDVRERYFGKRARIRPRGRKPQPDQPRFDRGYANTLTGIDQVEELREQVRALRSPATTIALLGKVKLDEKTGLGALRMFDVQGECHCCSGGRSQLIWHAGPRREDHDPPRLLRKEMYELLVDVLRQSGEEWLATDYLMRQIGSGASSTARKDVLGALKALVVLELADTAMYGRQAAVWQWTGPDGSDFPVYDRNRVRAELGRKRGGRGGWITLPANDSAIY